MQDGELHFIHFLTNWSGVSRGFAQDANRGIWEHTPTLLSFAVLVVRGIWSYRVVTVV